MLNSRPTRTNPYCKKLPAAYAPADVCTKPNFDAVCLSACKKEHLPKGKCMINSKLLYNKSEVIVYYIILLCIWYIRKKKESIVGERDECNVHIFVIHERDAN